MVKKRKLNIVSVVGARPQFIKAAMISRAIGTFNRRKGEAKIREVLVHSGQHYDHEMSQVFFDQLNIPKPDYHLGVGSGPHGRMTGEMLAALEKLFKKEQPDWVVVYGDTNTTLAGAFAAAKLPIPVAHVEAGLRSNNRNMPEEINRLLTDHLSSLLFCPTDTATSNLIGEGIEHGVFKTGDVMYDAFLVYKNKVMKRLGLLKKLKIETHGFCLATVHRQENTDNPIRLRKIFGAFDVLAKKDCPFIIPIHPRTLKALRSQAPHLPKNRYVKLIQPLHYLDMLTLELRAKAILTDSGGIQKEAAFAQVPCLTLRDETEWVETLEAGWNQLVGAKTNRIVQSFHSIEKPQSSDPSRFFGDGHASETIVDSIVKSSPCDLTARKPRYAENQIAQFQTWLRQA